MFFDHADGGIRSDKQHIKRYFGVFHPHFNGTYRVKTEYHAIVDGHLCPMHETFLQFFGGLSNFDIETDVAVGSFDCKRRCRFYLDLFGTGK